MNKGRGLAVLCCGFAQAVHGDEAGQIAPLRLAELVVAPAPATPGSSAAKRAAENRDQARGYQTDKSATPGTTVIVVPDNEDGVLAPRGTPLPDNRSKARDYQRGSNTGNPAPVILITPERKESGKQPESARESLEENRSKARTYMKGESPFGEKGERLPEVSCRDVNSVSGRIGDDSQSGSVITIMRDGRPYKVRCK